MFIIQQFILRGKIIFLKAFYELNHAFKNKKGLILTFPLYIKIFSECNIYDMYVSFNMKLVSFSIYKVSKESAKSRELRASVRCVGRISVWPMRYAWVKIFLRGS